MDMEMLGILLQTLAALAAVIGLAYVVLRFGKKVTEGQKTVVRILEKTPLGNQSYLAVAQVGKTYHLISVTSGQVSLLKELDPLEVEDVLEEKKLQLEENPLTKFVQMRKKRE